jgi:hypothetical protein
MALEPFQRLLAPRFAAPESDGCGMLAAGPLCTMIIAAAYRGCPPLLSCGAPMRTPP